MEAIRISRLDERIPLKEGNHSLTTDDLKSNSRKCTPNPHLTDVDTAAIIALWVENYDSVYSHINRYLYTIYGELPPNKPGKFNNSEDEREWRAATKVYCKKHEDWMRTWISVVQVGESGWTIFILMKQSKSGKAANGGIFTVQRDSADAPWRYTHRSTRNIEDSSVPVVTDDFLNELDEIMDEIIDEENMPNGSGDAPNTNRGSNGQLPPNLISGFGGVDASCAVFDPVGFKSNLFDLDISNNAKTSSFRSTGIDGTTTYTLPQYLNFAWTTTSDYFSVVSQSKREFTHNLSQHMNLGFSIFGFGAEFKRSFSEDTREETFQKYMVRYDQEMVYRVGFKDPDSAIEHLTTDAKDALAKWDAEKVIRVFGTHYMTEAYFGGLRIHSSTLDTRDTFSKKELKYVVDVKIPLKDPDTGADVGKVTGDGDDFDKVTESISDKMDSFKIRTYGGIAPDENDGLQGWRRSIVSDPAIVKYKLKPIDELITDQDRKKKLQAAIKDHLAGTQPIDSCSVLAIRVPLKPYFSDRDSRSKHDLTVAYPDVPDGWLRVGQFAQPGKAENCFHGQSYGLAVKANPNLDLEGPCPHPPVVAAKAATMQWNNWTNGVPFGFYTPTYDAPTKVEDALAIIADPKLAAQYNNYAALGDIFEPATETKWLKDLDKVACFHKDCMVDIPGGSNFWLWDDTSTGASKDVMIVGAPTAYAGKDDGKVGEKKKQKLVNMAKETSDSYVFKCLARGADWPNQSWKMLDWSKVKLLENKWLADLK